MNLCIFGGNFVRKPELKHVGPENVAVVNFSLAVNRVFNKKDGEKQKDTTYLDCEAWDTGAETIARNCDKGDFIIVYTSARTESWDDKETGKKRSRMKFRVDRFEFVPNTKRRSTETVTVPPEEQEDSSDAQEDIPF